jgi:hypothetical protein
MWPGWPDPRSPDIEALVALHYGWSRATLFRDQGQPGSAGQTKKTAGSDSINKR